jgi:hypothetical protein
VFWRSFFVILSFSFGHCIVWSYTVYHFWGIVLSGHIQFITSGALYCLVIHSLSLLGHCTVWSYTVYHLWGIVLSGHIQFITSGPLYCLVIYSLSLLIIPLVFANVLNWRFVYQYHKSWIKVTFKHWHLLSVVELGIKLMIWLAIITFLIPNPTLS